MASTFSLKSDSYGGRYLILECSQEKDIVNNKSKITWKLSSVGGNASNYTIAPTTVKINGTVVYSIGLTLYEYNGFPVTKGSVSGTIYVDHDSLGNKTIPVFMSTNIYYLTPIEYKENWTLDNIPMNAYITSCADFTDNSNPTVQYKNPIGASAESLDICITFDGSKDDIPYRSLNKSGTSFTFNLTEDERDILRNGTSGSTRNVGFCIRTVIGSTILYDTQYKKLTIQETDKTKPSVSISYSANNGIISSTFDGLYIKGKSKVNVSITSQAQYGSNITDISTVIQGETYKGSSFTSDYLLNPGDNIQISCTVKDGRGFENSPNPTPTIKVYSYEKPKLSNVSGASEVLCYRSNTDGTKNNSSNMIMIKAKKVFSQILVNGSNLNTCTMRYRTKKASSTSFGSWNTLTTTNDSYNDLISGTFDITNAYTIELGVVDTVGESDTIVFDIPTNDVPLHLGEGGKNVGIGRYADTSTEYNVKVGWETYFENNVNISGNLSISGKNVSDFIVEQGTSNGWVYRKWNSGVFEQWSKKTVQFTSWINLTDYWYYGDASEVTFGKSFYDIPIINVTNAMNPWAIPVTQDITNTNFKLYGIRPNAGNTDLNSYYFSIQAIGRWKA